MKKLYSLVLLLLSAALVYALTVEEKQQRILEHYSYELRTTYAWSDEEMKALEQHLHTYCTTREERIMVMRHVVMREKHHKGQQFNSHTKQLLNKTDALLKKIHERKNEMKQLRKQINANDKRERKKGPVNPGNGNMGD